MSLTKTIKPHLRFGALPRKQTGYEHVLFVGFCVSNFQGMVPLLRIMQRGGALCLLSACFASGTLPHTRGNLVTAGASTPAAPLSPPAQHPNVQGSGAPAKRPAGVQGARVAAAAPQGHAPSAGDQATAWSESRQQQGKALPPTAPHRAA